MGGGGAGGGSGSSASGGAGGIAKDAGSGGAIDAGTGGAPDGGAPDALPPIDTICAGKVAFWAAGASFAFPTPKALAAALGSLTFEYERHPITLVLDTQADGGGASVAISATVADASGYQQVFPPGQAPAPVAAVLTAGGITTAQPEAQGWLRVEDQSGVKAIELHDIELEATTSNKCNTLLGVVTALIPVSQGNVVLELATGKTTIATLAGESADGGQTPDGGTLGWNIRMMFLGESTDFDFESL